MTYLDAKLSGWCTTCHRERCTDETVTCPGCRAANNARVRVHLAEKRAGLRARHLCVDCHTATSRYRCISCTLRVRFVTPRALAPQ